MVAEGKNHDRTVSFEMKKKKIQAKGRSLLKTVLF